MKGLLVLVGAAVILLSMGAFTGAGERAESRYDFRTSPAYAALAEGQRDKLQQVTRDLALLWGALDMYADWHGGRTPEKLDDLVPLYLPDLPRDPFATEQTARERMAHGVQASVDGWGYRYMRGAPSNRAWCLSSAGLPDFPFLAEKGNVGLYVCKGVWVLWN
jgi:hypothetical protein